MTSTTQLTHATEQDNQEPVETSPNPNENNYAKNAQCSICRETIKNLTGVRPCCHDFCWGCILLWIRTCAGRDISAPVCPVCRTEMVLLVATIDDTGSSGVVDVEPMARGMIAEAREARVWEAYQSGHLRLVLEAAEERLVNIEPGDGPIGQSNLEPEEQDLDLERGHEHGATQQGG